MSLTAEHGVLRQRSHHVCYKRVWAKNHSTNPRRLPLIFGHGRQERLADFLELARDAVIEQVSAPTIGKADASGLFRLSIVVTTMLRNAADEQIALLNTPS